LKRKIRLRHFAPDADPCIDEDAPPRGDDDDPAVHAVVYTLPRRREEKALGCPATIGVIILVVVVPFVLFAMLQNSGGSSSSDGHSTGASTPAAVQQPAKPGSPAAAARSASDSPRHPASAVQQPTSAPAAQGRRAEAADLERQKAQQAAQDELARVQAAQQESLTSANEAINEANRLLEAGDLAGHFTKFDLSSNHIYNAYIVMITYWKERAKAGDPAAEVEMRASAKVLLDALDELEKSLWKAHKMLMSRCDEARESGDVDTGFRMIQLAQGRLKRMEVIRYHRSFAQEQLLMR
jgi:hypothetical protein